MAGELTNDLVKLSPRSAKSLDKLVFDFPEVQLSTVQYDEGPVGCTLIYFPKGGKSYIDIRGGMPGIVSYPSTGSDGYTDGVCIAGGSLMGRECIMGTNLAIWREKKYEIMQWGVINGSIIYTGNLKKNRIYPDKDLGLFAFQKLKPNRIYRGQVGAGASASYGQGASFRNVNGIRILCVVVLNAIGNIYKEGEKLYKSSDECELSEGKNTTITVLITDLKLSHNNLKQLARQCHTSMAEVIRPFNTLYDGDTFYACSTDTYDKPNINLYEFFLACSEVVKEAVYTYKI